MFENPKTKTIKKDPNPEINKEEIVQQIVESEAGKRIASMIYQSASGVKDPHFISWVSRAVNKGLFNDGVPSDATTLLEILREDRLDSLCGTTGD